jgi:hypothetical protein
MNVHNYTRYVYAIRNLKHSKSQRKSCFQVHSPAPQQAAQFAWVTAECKGRLVILSLKLLILVLFSFPNSNVHWFYTLLLTFIIHISLFFLCSSFLSVYPSPCLLFLKLKPQGQNFQVGLPKAISKDYTQPRWGH